jgi:putative MATE family efflux protein
LDNKHVRDFTKGSILRHLIIFSIPMFLGNLLQALYNTVDSIWVGHFLGANALGAVSVGFPIIFALIALMSGITMATTVLVAQYFGAGQMDRLNKAVNNSLVLLTASGIILSVIGVVFREFFLKLINTPPEIFRMASAYMQIYMWGLLGMFLYNVVSAILRGLGDSRTPLIILAYATIMNIVLDPVLIFGFGPIPAMGVSGAALATILAQLFSAVISFKHLSARTGIIRYSPDMFRLDFNLVKLMFRIGLPAGVQQVLVALSSLAVNSIANSFGAEVVAGFGAATRLDQFAFMPAMSVNLAVSALVGQNLGAGKIERVYETVKWSFILSAGITSIVSFIAFVRPDILMVLFTKDDAVLAEGVRYLRFMGFGYIPLALMFTISGVLRGAGDTTATMVLTLMSLWLFRIPVAKYLSSIPSIGVSGVWIAIALSPFVGFVLHLAYYRMGWWKSRQIIERQN